MFGKIVIWAVVQCLAIYCVVGQDASKTAPAPKPATDPVDPVTKPKPAVDPVPKSQPPNTGASAGAKYPLDEEKYNSYKEKICPLIPKMGEAGSGSKWNDELTMEEVFELALLNMGYGLTTDAIAHLPNAQSDWRKGIIDTIAYIAKTTCSTPAISSRFFHGVKNLFLYYVMKVMKSSEGEGGADSASSGGENNTEEWSAISKALYSCANDVAPIPIRESCGMVHTFLDKAGNEKEMGFVLEQLDAEVNEKKPLGDVSLDLVIDGMWWMFSTTYARCYAYFYPDEDIILTFYKRFRDDFLEMLSGRWVGAGELQAHFSIIFGPVNANEEYLNLRRCATAAYNYEGLVGRHLVRPLVVTMNGVPVRNFKTSS